jgi:hypothetical protein
MPAGPPPTTQQRTFLVPFDRSDVIADTMREVTSLGTWWTIVTQPAHGINRRPGCYGSTTRIRPEKASGRPFNVAWLLAGVAAWLAINLALVYLRTRRARDEKGRDPGI